MAPYTDDELAIIPIGLDEEEEEDQIQKKTKMGTSGTDQTRNWMGISYFI